MFKNFKGDWCPQKKPILLSCNLGLYCIFFLQFSTGPSFIYVVFNIVFMNFIASCLHFLACFHFTTIFLFWFIFIFGVILIFGYHIQFCDCLDFCGCLEFWGHLGVVFIFEVVFIFWDIFISKVFISQVIKLTCRFSENDSILSFSEKPRGCPHFNQSEA